MKKAAVKITGTAKSTGGNAKNMKIKPLGSSSDKAQLKKASLPKRPFGELPKRMSGFAQIIAEGYPELGKSGAAALAGKIRKEIEAGNKAYAAKMKTDKASKKAK